MLFILKAALWGLIVAIIATVARRQPALGALIASLPLISVMGMVWLWLETHDAPTMEAHAGATFWYVIPSLPMFLLIPALMRAGVGFDPALAAGCAVTVGLYFLVTVLGRAPASDFDAGLEASGLSGYTQRGNQDGARP